MVLRLGKHRDVVDEIINPYCQYLHCFLRRFDCAKRGILTEALRPKWRMHRPRPEREQEYPVLAAMQSDERC